ncbi:c-type cytochrome [Yoonia sp. I 8.24]|uniref:c-type cytochrome n=1 Tax=Yoonia sp. I 8.24 TaxID=1537229 RepID=UPI001EE0E1AF|nr:c-type cytochrome [Yoonia sp. I 8.24]MCG3266608.1 c-type cytochrome [Yoonia sp. I 8.24]
MSKSLNIFIPAVCGTGVLLGAAYGWTARDYKDTEVDALALQLEQLQASSEATRANAQEGEAQALRLQSELETAQEMVNAATSLTAPAPISNGSYDVGRTAHEDEIAAWDVDVLPDGRGLPAGSGDVYTGEEVFVDKCASCHGDFAEGVGNWPVLAGGFDTLADEDPVKTVGSYWPHLSTAWDYINRSMPFGEAGTLTADETYAIVAYIMYSNDMVDDDYVLSHENFADVEMHNSGGFVFDDRPELEYAQWQTEPCMTNCKPSVEITMRATFLDVTPDDGGDSVMNDGSAHDSPVFTATADASNDASADDGEAEANAALIVAGEGAFRQCKTCHEVGEGASNRTGPALNGMVGRTIGTVDGFRYSGVFQEAAAAGTVWTEESLAEFLTDPRGMMAGTRMSFRGVRDEADLAGLIAYIQSFAE